MPADKTSLFELRQHPVNGGKTELLTTLQQQPINGFSTQVGLPAFFEDLEDFQPGRRYLEPNVAQILLFHNDFTMPVLSFNLIMTLRRTPHHAKTAVVVLALSLALSACVYRIDIQQGNLLEEDSVAQVEVGMSRSAVEFLLGTPMVADSFHQGRWDYPYYLRRGRSDEIFRRWIVVYFEDDLVSRIELDLTLEPSS